MSITAEAAVDHLKRYYAESPKAEKIDEYVEESVEQNGEDWASQYHYLSELREDFRLFCDLATMARAEPDKI